MITDCNKFVAKCEQCQRHAPTIHQPTELLRAGVAHYPFMRWAMDIVGPLPTSGQIRFILVMIDYFTKWVEAESYATIRANDVQNFVWKFIICRHGLPYEMITDNGSQFISLTFEDFCASWKIRLNKSTLRYPQGNGQVESTNKTILAGLKERLDTKKENGQTSWMACSGLIEPRLGAQQSRLHSHSHMAWKLWHQPRSDTLAYDAT